MFFATLGTRRRHVSGQRGRRPARARVGRRRRRLRAARGDERRAPGGDGAVLWVTGRSSEILVRGDDLRSRQSADDAQRDARHRPQHDGARRRRGRCEHPAARSSGARVCSSGLHFNAPSPVLAAAGARRRGLAGRHHGAGEPPRGRPSATASTCRCVRVALIESLPFFINSLALGVLSSLGHVGPRVRPSSTSARSGGSPARRTSLTCARSSRRCSAGW